MKRILPSLPFLPVGLNDAVKILFYDKSFNWMTPWHYRTLERKPNVYTTNLEKEKILFHLSNNCLRAYVPDTALGAEDKSSEVWKLLSLSYSRLSTIQLDWQWQHFLWCPWHHTAIIHLKPEFILLALHGLTFLNQESGLTSIINTERGKIFISNTV